MSKYLHGLYRAGMKNCSYFLVPAIVPKNLMVSNHFVFILVLEYYTYGIF